MPRSTLVLATAALLLSPAVALAHPGHHEDAGLLDNLRHLATQPDHLLAAGALLLIALAGGGVRLVRARVRARR
ncbi:HupE/UreJ family protein [Phenylobacterium sp. LjRoot219]|uniref:HupE/UreJ family protein n=1 Tax=Phenylobacterium sp. LjRoot219 TaxID=3342283 RepID=UPI003ECD1ED0